MNIIFENGDALRGDMCSYITQRLDGTPMPATVEALVQVDPMTAPLLDDGKLFSLVAGGAKYKIVYAKDVVDSSRVQGSRMLRSRHIIAFLESCIGVTYIQSNATILNETSFGAAYRALGCKVNVKKDAKVAHFVTFAGKSASIQMAKQFTEEGVLCWWGGDGINFERNVDLFSKTPVLTIQEDGCERIDSGMLIRHIAPSVYSPSDSGAIDRGVKKRKVASGEYRARVTKTQMGNMQDFLILRRIASLDYAPNIKTGDIVVVGDTKHVVVTAAHTRSNGVQVVADGTRLWLYSLNGRK